MRVFRLKGYARKKLPEMDGIAVSLQSAESMEELELAHHLAKRCYERETNIAKKLKYEWFTGPWGGALSKQAETGHIFTWPSIPVGRRWVVKVRVTDPDGASAEAIVEFDQKP